MKLSILFSGVILGLSDGILNPCTLTVIIFLITNLLHTSENRKKILIGGFLFALGVFIVYFLFLLASLKIIYLMLTKYGDLAFKLLGIIAIILGLLEIKDYFWYGKGISLKIPSFLKPYFKKIMKFQLLISSFLLGVFSSLAEIPCAGFFPFAYASLIVNYSFIEKIFYLLWYMVFFILPIILLILAFYYGLSLDLVKNFLNKNKKYMRLITGIIFLILGLIFLIDPKLFF